MSVVATAVETVYPHITKSPSVCSGRACVAGTRVRVMDIVSLHPYAARHAVWVSSDETEKTRVTGFAQGIGSAPPA